MKRLLFKRFRSLQYAFSGLRAVFVKDGNMWLHLLAALFTIAAGIYFRISPDQWLWIILCITLVLVTEIINTAIEHLCDLYTTERNEKIRVIKDISAAAVLLTALFTIVVAAFIFLQHV